MKPKKALGQNFLTSIPARIAIAQAGALEVGDKVLEIGPGKGFLTEELLNAHAAVVALEKDQELIPYLTEKFSKEHTAKRFSLIEGDALTFDPENAGLKPGEYKLIANIPYYITGAIISRYLSEVNQPKTMVVLVQKEVAERVCARDGKESLLSLSVKVYGEPKLVYKVSKGSFFPIPKVDSAVLQITSISKKNFLSKAHEELFFKLIHAGFAHKRKFVLSNIQTIFKDDNIRELFITCSIHEKARAEDLALATWLTLAEKLLTK